ncbi:NADP-dependent glyceraldehyde-3-phosphate dehydrogenase [Camellia lanceoleosa]|nr:NADP-dependent glyceraldehyde-3-phosphate dehydrogenase [Camellia lanceoleosa]
METAKTAQKLWAKTLLWKRAELLHKAAAILKEHKAPIAECLVKEIAKPAKEMLVDDIGDAAITNDGAIILKMLDVEHPAAKVEEQSIHLAELQDREVGNGTTTVVIISVK